MFDLPALFERASEHLNGKASQSSAGADVAGQTSEDEYTQTMDVLSPADEWPGLLEASGLGLTFDSDRQIDRLIALTHDDAVIDDVDRLERSQKSST